MCVEERAHRLAATKEYQRMIQADVAGEEPKNVSVSQNSKYQYLQGESEGKRGLLTHLLESVES
jgi:hypothetical protein